MSTTRGKPDIGLHCLPFLGSIKKSFVLLPSSPLQYGFLPYRYSSFGLRFPSGPLNLPRLSETPYLLRMRNTELRLLNPLTFQMSSMECPLLYIATIVFSRSALLMFFSLVGWLIFCFRWMMWLKPCAAWHIPPAKNRTSPVHRRLWFPETNPHGCQSCREWRQSEPPLPGRTR